MKEGENMQECNIMGVNIAVTNMEDFKKYVEEHLDELRGQYICVSNVHTTVMAYENPEYLNVQNSAAIRMPDGSPLSKTAKKKGFKDAQRVTGPSYMLKVLSVSKEKGYRHVFYGSTLKTIEKMKANIKKDFPGVIDNCLFISPEFKKQAEFEKEEVIKQINGFKPDFIWVGLGAPKQENWMYIHKGKLNAVCIGVGAAFDYLAGNIKRAPKWMQKCSLEWLYRLLQNPKLFHRYCHSNIKFLKVNICIRRERAKEEASE